MSTAVFAPYPLSRSFRDELTARYGDVHVHTVAELRRIPPLELVRTLRRIRGRVVLATETSAAEAVFPALEALASLTRAAAVEVVRRGQEPHARTRPSVSSVGANIVRASLDGALALAATERSSARLRRAARLDAQANVQRGLLMLNVSPWIGLSSGGAVAHTAGVANGFAAEGVPVVLATYGDVPGLVPDVEVQPLRAPHGYGLPADVNRLRFARAARPSFAGGLVYERASLGSTAGAELSRRLRVPLVVEYNGSELWAARHWGGTTRFAGVAARAEAATLRQARVVVTVSQPLRNELVARGVEPQRVVMHPNGVDPDRFDPARLDDSAVRAVRDRYRIPADAVLATFVGTFGHWHGAELLAEAAARVPIHFLFVGDGVRAPQVRALLSRAGDRAALAGIVEPDEVPVHLAASDILVSPHVPNPDGSPFFGSPTKLFEYMASGRAIVASDLGQIGDVLRDGAAVLVEPGSVDALVRGLEQAAADAELRERLGRRARKLVLERYTWRAHVRAILGALS